MYQMVMIRDGQVSEDKLQAVYIMHSLRASSEEPLLADAGYLG